MNLTWNLKQALKDLRYLDRPRVLWVDAVCINQSDLLEKENQVNRMGEIFRYAERTIIHMQMGFDHPGIRRLLPVLQELHRLYECLLAGEMDLSTLFGADKAKLKPLAPVIQLLISHRRMLRNCDAISRAPLLTISCAALF